MEQVSVIVPVYKVEKYLAECVESIRSQTYKNIEIILVDDGSPDSCPVMCDAFALGDSRVRVIHKQNGGLSSARNAGLDVAAGEYICFVDSDDYISDDMVSVLYEAAKNADAEMALCSLERFGDGTQAGNYLKHMPFEDGVLTSDEVCDLLTSMYEACYAVACNKLYKKSLFDGLRFTEGRINEDEFIMHRLYMICSKVAVTVHPGYYYRNAPDSITTSKWSIKKFDSCEAFFDRYQFFLDAGKQLFANRSLQSYLSFFQENTLRYFKCDEKPRKEFRGELQRLRKRRSCFLRNSHYSMKEKFAISIFLLSPRLYFKLFKWTGR